MTARLDQRNADRLLLLPGDCREVMSSLDECSVDAIVTDPPYGIHFMGKTWDAFGTAIGVDHKTTRERSGSMHAGLYDLSLKANRQFQDWCASWGTEALRILKPGASMVVSGSPRTYHRMASGLEDAGFEIRDCLQWLFGSGFPKSLNLHGEWEGWGTALKPAYEPIVLARKPLQGTVAGNVERWGTGGLNIDASRIEGAKGWPASESSFSGWAKSGDSLPTPPRGDGRWPANVLLDAEAARLLDAMSGELHPPMSGGGGLDSERVALSPYDEREKYETYADRGGASRFFYVAKASRAEREYGLDDLEPQTPGELTGRKDGAKGTQNPRAGAGRELPPNVKLDAWEQEVLRAALLGDTGSFLLKATEGFTRTDGSEWSTWLSGSALTDLSQRASKYTTETKTNSTIESRTYNSSIPSPISAFIRDALSLMESGSSPAVYAASVSRLMENIGISADKAGRSMDAAADAISARLSDLSRIAASNRKQLPPRRNLHPTVKPLDLMRWLCRLITPPGGTILDPFMGSGSTGMAALDEGFQFIGIDMDEHYIEIARRRIARRHLLEPLPQREAGQGVLL